MRRLLALSLPLLGLAACSQPSGTIESTPPVFVASVSPVPAALETVVLQGMPFVEQKPDFCGEACVEMAARRLGKTYDQDSVFAMTGIDPALGRGAYTRELARAAKSLGFDPGEVWGTIDAADPGAGLDAAFAALHADLRRGVPSIVCMHYDERPKTTEHFRLVIGYDRDKDEIVYQEPAEKNGGYRRMSRARLFQLWPLKYEDKRWTLVRIALAPAALADPPKEGGFSRAGYAQHVLHTRDHLASLGLEGLNVRIEEPFVVLGDDPPEKLARRAETVRWAVDHLRKDFFSASPKRILDVYLFKDEASYTRGVKAFTKEAPSTPYGFYSSDADGLFMNISTGGGTLVHEIVHPFVEADFPEAPAWLNEGLGSLFEQSAERDGHIVGLPNWRLRGLKKAIKAGTLPSFFALTHLSDHAFYNEDRGDNYAQARYLLYWLQEEGKLVSFYAAFKKNKARDPSGYDTLVATLGERDMDAFEARWEAWVMTLRYPY